MRISDWSSDVCSSDLRNAFRGLYRSLRAGVWLAHAGRMVGFGFVLDRLHVADVHVAGPVGRVPHLVLLFEVLVRAPVLGLVMELGGNCLPCKGPGGRPDRQAGTDEDKPSARDLVVRATPTTFQPLPGVICPIPRN